MAGTQSLFDTLAGAAGHGVDRPGLEAFVANSQSINGLRTAQTESALLNAQKAKEEQQARADLEGALSGVLGDDGQPLLSPSKVALVKSELISGAGNAVTVMEGLRKAQEAKNTGILSNPANLGTAAATAASQGNTSNINPTESVPADYTVKPGMPPPVVQTNPSSQANIELTALKTQHPELFHTPNAGQLDPQTAAEVAEFIRQNPQYAGNIRSLVSMGGSAVVHAFLHPESAGNPNATPAALGAPNPGPGTAVPGAKPPPAPPAAPGVPKVPKVAPATAPGAAPAPSTQPSAVAPANGILPAPGVSLHEQALIRNDFASGVGARQATALSTMGQHANLFDQIADQLDNGNFTPTNAIAQSWAKLFGSAVPGNLQIAAAFLGREAVRATVNSGAGTGEERELAVGQDSSPSQLHGAASTLRVLAAGQLHSLDRRAKRGGVDITQLLDPEIVQQYGLRGPPPGPKTSFATEAEAQAESDAGRLPDNTAITIAGQPGRWHH